MSKNTLSEKARIKADEREEKERDVTTEKIDAYIERCRELYRSPLISDVTRDEYEKMFEEIRDQGKLEWAQGNVQFLKDTLLKASHAREFFEANIQSAATNGWISAESARRWMARFYDPQVLEWQREKWLKEEFPAYCERWKAVAQARVRTLDRAKAYDLHDADEPGLSILRDSKRFLALDYDHRAELVARIDALVLAAAYRKQKAYTSIRGTLQAAARGRAVIDTSQVGPLLKQALTSPDPEVYLQDVLQPLIDRRTQLRAEFDAVMSSLKNGAPVGLRIPSDVQFLRWSEMECGAYLVETRARIALWERAQKGEEAMLDAAKRGIRASMDTQDWEGADASLQALIVANPEDQELAAMRAFLDAHRPLTPSEEAPMVAVLEQMRTIVRHVPIGMQALYLTSLTRGSSSFGSVMEHMYMAVWRADQLTHPLPLIQQTDPEPNDVIAVERMDEHDQSHHNEEANETPAVLGMAEGTDAVQAVQMLEQEDAHAHASRYNGLVTESVTLKQQRYLVDHVNSHLMRHLRQLESRGARFEMAV